MRVLFCWSFFGCVVFKKRRVLVGDPVCFFLCVCYARELGVGFATTMVPYEDNNELTTVAAPLGC